MLDAAIGGGYRVFAQVRFAELAEDEKGVGEDRRRRALNRVLGKSVDLVVCAAASLEPVAAIEVDDRSHLLANRKERDPFVDSVFVEIGLPLVRMRARRDYPVAWLREFRCNAGIGQGVPAAAFGRRLEHGPKKLQTFWI
ncbi:MAG: DUF2726 domain-containing protein [Methylocella sp.]